MQPKPLILFTWDGWWQDMKCSLIGPSSLFQRWNLQLRQNYNLLADKTNKDIENDKDVDKNYQTNYKIQLLLIIRRTKQVQSSMYASRVFANEYRLIQDISSFVEDYNSHIEESRPKINLIVQDLAVLKFEDQIRLISVLIYLSI
jgi:O-glycosyl hydrolase